MLAVPATAQLKHIPPGDRTDVAGDTKSCYVLDDYKKLLKFDVEYDTCLQAKALFDQKNKLQDQRILDLGRAITVQKDSIDVLKTENARIFEQWKEENKKRHVAENKPAFGSYIAWGTAGAFAVATVVLTAVVVLKD